MTPNNYLNLRQQIDELISSYELDKAKELISSLKVDEVPAKMRANFAHLARRVELYKQGVKLLQPNIYGTGEPSSADLLEYASCIRRLGLVNQSLLLLNRISDLPENHLYKAFCHVQNWNYKSAQSEFENYLDAQTIASMQTRVAQVNLASSYLFNDELDKAEKLLQEITAPMEKTQFHLYLNCLELKGRLHLKKDRTQEACNEFDHARELSQLQTGHTNLFIMKWHLIAKCSRGEISPHGKEIQEFKQMIRQEKHWESLRSLDWELARISRDFTLINFTYFGTPFEAYKQKMREQLCDYHFPEKFLWMDGRPHQRVGEAIDFYHMDSVPVPFGMNLHRLWMLLASDFYQPWTVERIFNSLFSDEIYDPFTSPKRIYSMEEKLQQIIKDKNVNMELKTTSNGYRLRPMDGNYIYVYNKMNFANQEEFIFHLLKRANIKKFNLRDIESVIPLSHHQWYRLLKKMEEGGLLGSENEGHKIKYRLKSS